MNEKRHTKRDTKIMTNASFFGEWIAQRRKLLDRTQRELAAQTHCALVTIKKIETGERRPSRELAVAIADVLHIPLEAQHNFIDCARGVQPVEVLSTISTQSSHAPTVPSVFVADLPANPTPFIERTREVVQIAQLLERPDCRLLTLVGTGGAGKTRLALEVARAQRDHYADGVVMIPLAAVTDSSLVPAIIAQRLGLALAGATEMQLVAYLHDKSMLLVLDNCEQLTEGMAWLSDLLTNAPNITLLVTSRERLLLTAEWMYTVPMFDEAQAVALFEQIASRLNSSFHLAEQRDAVRTICQLVEHLPLGIELAASWMSCMTCAEIVRNIQRDIDFLSANGRTIPERHRSIRAVFGYSWRLLTPVEQEVMMRLSVFRGGWTIDEAESIANGTVFILRALVEKSLVHPNGYGRYALHELIRQYAAEQLHDAGKAAQTRQRHAEVYLTLAGTLDSQLHTSTAITAFARLDQEQDNMRAGLSWALEMGAMDQARQYVDKLFLYWWRRGHWAEGEAWSKAIDARSGESDSTLLCWGLIDIAFFLILQGRFTEAMPYMSRAEAMAQRLEDPETTLRLLMVQVQTRSDIEAVAATFELFFATAKQVQEHSKSSLEAMIAAGHNIYGNRLREAGRTAEAEAQYRQSLDLWQRMGNADAIAYAIGDLGRLALQAGRLQEAYDQLNESVVRARTIGNRVAIADWLPHMGNIFLRRGDIIQAEACYNEALVLCEEMGNQMACADIVTYLGYTALMKNELLQSRHYLRRSVTAYHTFSETRLPMDVEWIGVLPPEWLLCLKAMALVDVMENQFERALMLLSATAALQARCNQGDELGVQAQVTEALRTLQIRFSQETFVKIWETGQSMSAKSIMAYVLETA